MTLFHKPLWPETLLQILSRRHRFLVIGLIALVALAACAPKAPPPPDPEAIDAQVRRTDVHEAKDAVDQRKAILVDTRSVEEFRERRAAGAISAPLGEIARNPVLSALTAVPPEMALVFYCT